MISVEEAAAKIAYLRSGEGQALLGDAIDESLLKIDFYEQLASYENVSLSKVAM